MLTPEQLEELSKLEVGATKEPWGTWTESGMEGRYGITKPEGDRNCVDLEDRVNARFIAAIRNAAKELIQQAENYHRMKAHDKYLGEVIERLEAKLEKAKAALVSYANRHEYSATVRVNTNLWACVALDFFREAEETLKDIS